MSNGKFFSGLPDSMLRGSSNRPDRMESHLFWPDESKTESVNHSNNTTPLKRATKPLSNEEVQYLDQSQANTPTAKELFSQHQTSKIQFNDYADDGDYGGSGRNSGVRNNNNNNNNNQNHKITSAQVKNTNITNNYNNRMGFNDNSAKLNALKSNIGFYDYPDESRSSKTTRSSNRQQYEASPKQSDATTKHQQQDYNQNDSRDNQKNNSISKSRSDENVLKCKMNNDLYDLDRKVNNLNINANKFNNSNNDYNNSVHKSSRITTTHETNNGSTVYEIPIKIHNETSHSSQQQHIATTYNTTTQRDHSNSQQYQNSQHSVPISLDRDYVSSRGCPQKSYNNITPLYSQQEQSPQ